MSPEAQFIIGLVALIVGGGFATLLYTLTNSILKTQQQQGSQQASWQAIIKEKDKQLEMAIAEKDRQIFRLESIIAIRDERIDILERRIRDIETRATKAELRVQLLEEQVKANE